MRYIPKSLSRPLSRSFLAPGYRTTPDWPRGTLVRRARGGTAALEFALLAPVVAIMLAGIYDISTGYVAWVRVTLAANSIAQIATTVAAMAATTETLSKLDASNASSAMFAYLPNALTGNSPPYSVVISSIAMTANGPGSATAYTAHVAWSGVFQNYNGPGKQRPCDASGGIMPDPIATDPPAPNKLPSSVYSAAPLLVVDVTYTYTPLFFQFLTGGITIAQSASLSHPTALTVNYIQYIWAAGDSTTLCAGYPSA